MPNTNIDTDKFFPGGEIEHPGLSCPENYKIRIPQDKVYTATDFVNNKPYTPTPPEPKKDISYSGVDFANGVAYPKE